MGKKKRKKNTDSDFTCPDGHPDIVVAGSLRGDLCDEEKYFCKKCHKFFYLNTMDGFKYFSSTISELDQEFTDSNLCSNPGFQKNSSGIIEQI